MHLRHRPQRPGPRRAADAGHRHHRRPTVDIQGVYSAIANAIQTVHTTRFLPPEVIVMHPRRWGWFLSLLDDQQRPLFLPVANGR